MNFDLWLKNTDKIISGLEILLATEQIANLKTRKYHRNVESKRFRWVHMYLESLYDASFERMDELAERIRILGAYAKGTFKEYLELSLLKEEERMNMTDTEMLEEVAKDKMVILEKMREVAELAAENGDVWTEGLITGYIETFEKDLWMLRSMLK